MIVLHFLVSSIFFFCSFFRFFLSPNDDDTLNSHRKRTKCILYIINIMQIFISYDIKYNCVETNEWMERGTLMFTNTSLQLRCKLPPLPSSPFWQWNAKKERKQFDDNERRKEIWHCVGLALARAWLAASGKWNLWISTRLRRAIHSVLGNIIVTWFILCICPGHHLSFRPSTKAAKETHSRSGECRERLMSKRFMNLTQQWHWIWNACDSRLASVSSSECTSFFCMPSLAAGI